MVHKAIDIAAPGDVIVVDAGGEVTHAIIGDIMSSLAEKRGVAGFVIYGAIRDAAEIGARRFPVYACGVTPAARTRTGRAKSTRRSPWTGWWCTPATSSSAMPTAWSRCAGPRRGNTRARQSATRQGNRDPQSHRRRQGRPPLGDELLRQRGCDF